MSEEKRAVNKLDYTLLFLVFLLACISFTALYNVQAFGLVNEGSNYLMKQVIWYVISIPVLATVIFIDLDIFKRLSLYLYIVGLILLAGILLAPESISPVINGAKGWYRIGPFSYQPAELVKILFILILSNVVSKSYNDEVLKTRADEMKLMGKMFLYLLPLIYFMQAFPDLGSLLVYISIFLSILIVSGIRLSTIGLIGAIPAAIVTFFIVTYFYFTDFFFKLLGLLPAYQTERFYGWLRPEKYEAASFQLRHSLLGIGSGELYGSSLLPYVPYAYSDFIFAVIGGLFGFLGASLVIIVFFLLIYRMVIINIEVKEVYGSCIGAGVIGMISYQVFQNIGMSLGLLPITGLSLPFISYGGSSLITNMIAIGLILNIKTRKRNYMFGD